ncbi:aldo/keto reductase [Schinkia azotoformans]|uniref:aldo/keto reductase n=1 Tax=Schinkia azotoformans TaxID=1454 RepID=UPI002DBBCBDC|nr:aldo/keto reductase [Schinkia azotoformans]MEC1769912.1 aldo/keto reductase [Schinkia azotoformans]MED4367192.1 aldo/keto reductase [Schinkia azotoformans]
MVYNIIEVANTHGGSIDYIHSLLDEYSQYKDGFGIKFQPFRYDEIATKDYEWYDVYKSIFIKEEDWNGIIDIAIKTKEIWLDIFDEYGIKILNNNISKISGIKLQASVLFNYSVLNALSQTSLNDKKVIINVAAYDIKQIKERIMEIKKLMNPREILIEIGFQSYPTELGDSGLSKITKIKANFNNRIVFADHVDGQSEESVILPVIASLIGADVVEKHVMHSSLETKYDMFSSITVDRYNRYITLQKMYLELLKMPFITNKEKEYLRKTIQIPILKEDVKKGKLVAKSLLSYKRCGKSGLNTKELENVIQNYNVLATDKVSGNALKLEDFKKANIATIVACRLKSTRLRRKALLPIGDYASIELCLKNVLKFENVNHTILATSTEVEDSELENYIYRNDVIFHRGDPDDVIDRYLGIARKLKIDIIIRVTGDCPYVSNDILQYLLQSHFEKGADYTTGKGAAVGTNIEIINVEALEKVKKYFPKAQYSEYMTWYFQNNPEHFELNIVNLPEKWCRNYRLTLDYEEDLILFNEIEKYFKEQNIEYSIDHLFRYLDKNPQIAKINSHLTLKFQSDKELIKTLNERTRISNMELGLGTVQFGIDYGITNQRGKTNFSEVKRILNFAKQKDIKLLDTAAAYGDSEKKLGDVIGSDNHFKIVTKITNIFNQKNIEQHIVNQVNQSLHNLQRDHLEVLMIHHAEDLLNVDGPVCYEVLKDLKMKNVISKIGCSIYEPNDIEKLLSKYQLDVIQVPINIFDQRLISGNYLKLLKEQKIEIHARSLFLQGLILMEPKNIPSSLKNIVPYVNNLRLEAEKHQLTPLQLALQFVKSITEIDYVIVGVNNLQQLIEIEQSFKHTSNNDVDFRKFAISDVKLIDPRKWNGV